MTKIELVQEIGSEVCDGCGPNRDCGIDPEECDRIDSAVSWLTQFIKQEKDN